MQIETNIKCSKCGWVRNHDICFCPGCGRLKTEQNEVISVLKELLMDVARERVVVESVSRNNGVRDIYTSLGTPGHELDGTYEITIKCSSKPIDKSDKVDAERFRWLLNGNGYFMEENYLCGHNPTSKEQDEARGIIDEAMKTRP